MGKSSKKSSSDKVSFWNYLGAIAIIGLILWGVGATVSSNPSESVADSTPTSSPAQQDALGNIVIPLGNSSIEKPSDIQGSAPYVNAQSPVQNNNSNPQSALKVKPGELEQLNLGQ